MTRETEKLFAWSLSARFLGFLTTLYFEILVPAATCCSYFGIVATITGFRPCQFSMGQTRTGIRSCSLSLKGLGSARAYDVRRDKMHKKEDDAKNERRNSSKEGSEGVERENLQFPHHRGCHDNPLNNLQDCGLPASLDLGLKVLQNNIHADGRSKVSDEIRIYLLLFETTRIRSNLSG
jgi:hypothetical protein